MIIHSLNQIWLVCVFSAALAVTALAQSTSKEKELQQKETELQKKEDDLDRQRRELDDARKQLRLEETAQSVTIRLESDVLFDSAKAQLRPEAQSALGKVAVVLAQFPHLPNGKIDRQALPLPGQKRSRRASYVPPTSDLEPDSRIVVWDIVLDKG